jgi:hypothetical protein
MQQDWPSKSIMTSRSFQSCILFAATLLLGACAAVPDDSPVVEDLDSETGITISRLGRPVELYRETFRQDSTGRFSFIGPFETNHMGSRALFLWVAVPVENAAATGNPTISADGKPLALGEPGRTADFASLRKSPYKIPTPWIAMYYFHLDNDALARLGEARSLGIQVTESTKEGNRKLEYQAQLEADTRLREFGSR